MTRIVAFQMHDARRIEQDAKAVDPYGDGLA